MENITTKFEVRGHKDENNVPTGIEISAVVLTLEDAKKIAAQFPKYLKVKACTISGVDGNYSDAGIRGYVYFSAFLTSDGVNGGVNETGLKRVRKFASLIQYEVKENWVLNALSKDEFEKVIRGVK